MLKVTNISKTFFKGTSNEKKALNGLSLTLNDGDFCTVIGGNGAGKSTLLNAIAGAYIPDAGTIEINGTDVTRVSEYKRAKYIGRVFQDPLKGTAAGMQVEENLLLASRRGESRRLKWAFSAGDHEKYRDMVARLDLGLEDRLGTRIGLLSGGQRQALTLLMATMKKPDILLLDEPTAALDPKTASKVLKITDGGNHGRELLRLLPVVHRQKLRDRLKPRAAHFLCIKKPHDDEGDTATQCETPRGKAKMIRQLRRPHRSAAADYRPCDTSCNKRRSR